MPLRHDGSGGPRSARSPTSTPAERIFRAANLEDASRRDPVFLPESYPPSRLVEEVLGSLEQRRRLAVPLGVAQFEVRERHAPCALARPEAPDAQIKVVEEPPVATAFAVLTRA